MNTEELARRMMQRNLTDYDAAKDAFDALRLLEPDNFALAHDLNKQLRQIAAAEFKSQRSSNFYDLYDKTLLFDAPHDFDAFLRYVEGAQSSEKKFYAPRRKYLLPVVKAYQEVLNGSLKLLTLSLPKRAGKLISHDTPVLTTNGFKKHGELVPGDYVYGRDNEPVMVIAKHPDSYAVYSIEFTNGEKILTSAEHEWPVILRDTKHICILETQQLLCRINDILMFVPGGLVGVTAIASLERPVVGNCITVEGGLYRVGKTQILTHNSQLGINFANFISGRNPNRSTLMEGTGDDLVKSFYLGCLEYLQTPNDYRYYDIFPEAELVQTNADSKFINLKDKSRFPTIMCRSIDARQVGLSEATNVLYLDDCVAGRDEAKNRVLLDQKWEVISGDIIGRAIEGTPIIATGTRYSLYDPIGRLQEEARKQHWPWKAIEIPALDPVTDESNYEYYNPKIGRMVFTTAFFREQREMLSAEQFESEFQQQPFEAKGLLFPEGDLNRYFQLPAAKDPDAIIAVCDTAEGGGDSVMMPIAYIYGDDVFIEDVVFDNSKPEVTKPQCAKKLFQHKVSVATFESNNAGTYYSRDVESILKGLGGKCSIRQKRTISNKQTRIEMASDGIMKHFWFKDRSLYAPSSQYALMLKELTTYTRTGKVPHDDSPDGLAMLENEVRNLGGNSVRIFARPY